MQYQHLFEWLDQHIWPQIQTMMLHDALFKLLSYAQQLTGDSNGPIGWLNDVGYVSYQLTAIRRLCDPRKDVISLRRLLKEIKSKKRIPKAEILDKLSSELDRCDHVCNMANNYIAHTANPLRRQNLSQWDLHPDHLTQAQKAICRVAVTLDRDVLQRKSPGAIIPVPQQDDLMQWLKPWMPEDSNQRIWHYWHGNRRTVNAWINEI